MDALSRLLASLRRLDGAAVVGALDPENARKLAWAETGTPTSDPRPTLSVTTDRLRPAIERSLRRQVGEVLDGKGRGVTGEEIVRGLAGDLREEVVAAIANNTPPPLAESTKADRRRRGLGTQTLVAEGDMMRSIKVASSSDPDAFKEDET